ncbi:AAA family ATPase [Pseudomonas frederiksbergensis]|uniref:AAA family ATPase n=1 Tax=Pseudomonas frederiksbergensis TaxID=104087 RepID=UPI003D19AD6C
MITSFEIKNFKSIDDIDLGLGRLNVFIGENGAGKSNVLEAIALAGAASAGKLDHEFLSSRGIRVTEPYLMKSAFDEGGASLPVIINAASSSGGEVLYKLSNEGEAYSAWKSSLNIKSKKDDVLSDILDLEDSSEGAIFLSVFKSYLASDKITEEQRSVALSKLVKGVKKIEKNKKEDPSSKISVDLDDSNPITEFYVNRRETLQDVRKSLSDFIIFSPENSALRDQKREGQILPLGINGEGLFKLLGVEIGARGKEYLAALNDFLSVFGWFEKIIVGDDSTKDLEISDRFICDKSNRQEVQGANEGFLFLLFYFALFSSELTPRFFAIDNIDASLNPKLCRRLVEELGRLAKKHNKQVLLTTHNPAVLDGLDLDDDEQRLIIVSRDFEGHTKIRRVKKPKTMDGAPFLRLSEAFMRGSLGGLPKGF